MLFLFDRGFAPLIATLSFLVSTDGAPHDVGVLARDVQTCTELREAIAADALSPAQPLVLTLPRNTLDCDEGVSVYPLVCH